MLDKELIKKINNYLLENYEPNKEDLLKYLDRLYYTNADKMPRKFAYSMLQHYILLNAKEKEVEDDGDYEDYVLCDDRPTYNK